MAELTLPDVWIPKVQELHDEIKIEALAKHDAEIAAVQAGIDYINSMLPENRNQGKLQELEARLLVLQGARQVEEDKTLQEFARDALKAALLHLKRQRITRQRKAEAETAAKADDEVYQDGWE